MKMEILTDVPVSPNRVSADANVACAYPFAAARGEHVHCVYRRGREKHSDDGVLLIHRSADGGRTWGDPIPVFHGLGEDPPQVVVTGTVGCTPAGTLISTLGIVEVTRPGVYLFSEEGLTQTRRVLCLESADGGNAWSRPREIEAGAFPSIGITTSPFVSAQGALVLPLEVRTPLGVQSSAILLSDDGGKTFGSPVLCADDPTGALSLCDSRCVVLRDGSILMLLWTFAKGSEETRNVHEVRSVDGGTTWTAPRATDMSGQIAVPLELPDGTLIAAVNYRKPPQGIRLYVSQDRGATWTENEPLQMWDAAQSQLLGTPVEPVEASTDDERVWDALPAFTFGTPDLTLIEDGTVLLTYYATVDGICHVRACRFRLD